MVPVPVVLAPLTLDLAASKGVRYGLGREYPMEATYQPSLTPSP
ncbi:MAG: hypothetical protein AVDCRST_MAG77-1932 [uncultured Chloroflexi bacterium]|uniref:Uncharacterized protein n=1 Tax=uncultured Chloroflexota bacterium TaxID=166587 RepID=A0A6J4GYE5_9CHLR|nr:MAG: hypothetical protein AVDCRST_MAG77-1932 [uncultured Chloroflexota bacterium]